MDAKEGPYQLQNKVQFDLRYYFCHRGNENFYEMTKETFKIKTHPDTGLKYITKQIDEQTKNHQGNEEADIISGHMPEMPNHPNICPVNSFYTYVKMLDPEVPWLWQTPKFRYFPAGLDILYTGRMGHNKLETFVARMAKEAGLQDEKYTNHTLHATGATNLGKKFQNNQVMAVTGHKSMSSLAIYQKVGTDEKLSMGYSLACSLAYPPKPTTIEDITPPSAPLSVQDAIQQAIQAAPGVVSIPALPGPSAPPTPNNENQAPKQISAELVPYQDDIRQHVPDFDLMSFVADLEDDDMLAMCETVSTNKNTVAVQKQMVKKSSPKLPVFSGCKIENITININKN